MSKKKWMAALERRVLVLENPTCPPYAPNPKPDPVPEVSGQWMPKEDEKYWIIDSEGALFGNTWHSGVMDRRRLAQGNVFRTQEEAETAAATRATLAEHFSQGHWNTLAALLRCDGARSTFVGGIENHTFYHTRIDLTTCFATWINAGESVYFDTAEQRDAALETVGHDRVIAMLRNEK